MRPSRKKENQHYFLEVAQMRLRNGLYAATMDSDANEKIPNR